MIHICPNILVFFFFGQKNLTEAFTAGKNFLLETDQNVDAISMFDRILWLKLQLW